MLDTLDRWQAGEITDQEAHDRLINDRAEVEEVYQRAKAALDVIRGQVERVVRRMGGKATGAGYTSRMVEASQTVSYDARALDSLVAELSAAGDVYTAGRIAQARKEKTRDGYLRIERVK